MSNRPVAHGRALLMLSAGLLLLGGCSVDRSGLGPPRSFVTTDGTGGGSVVGEGSGGQHGQGGATGATGSGGQRGEGGATGSGGDAGGAAGASGTGGAGDVGGSGGLAGGTGGLAGGTGGLTGGSGGVIDGTGGFVSGTGGVVAGTGGVIAGTGGFIFGGSGGRGFGCGACTPCQRCMNGSTCVLDPMSMWKMTCVSARVASTRPGGSTWDPLTSPPPGMDGPEPDPVCSLRMGPNTVAKTSVKMDTFDPMWNESIAPSSRLAADFLMSQASPWSIYVGDDDPMTFSGAETICQVAPQLTAADFASGTVTFSNVGSCLALVIGIQCAQ